MSLNQAFLRNVLLLSVWFGPLVPASAQEASFDALASGQPWVGWTTEELYDVDRLEVGVERVQVDGHWLQIVAGDRTIFSFERTPSDPELLSEFLALDPLTQKKFLKNREWALRKLATFLNSQKLGLGLFAIGGDKLNQMKKKVVQVCKKGLCTIRRTLGFDDASDSIALSPAEAVAADVMTQETMATPDAVRPTLRSRGLAITQQALESLNIQMWRQPRLVAEQNEIGAYVSIAPMFYSGVGESVRGGSAGIAMSIGFNRALDAMAVEIAAESETIQYAYFPILSAGLAPKVGLFIRNIQLGSELKGQSGASYYPPGFPGFATKVEDMIVGGGNTSLLSFPPGVGDAYTYLNKISRKPFIRITVSPMMRGFVRLHVGLPFNAQPVLTSLREVIQKVNEKAKATVKGCVTLFRLAPAQD